MTFRITYLLFVLLLTLNTSSALDLYVKDTFVNSKVRYTLSNHDLPLNFDLYLTTPSLKKFKITSFNNFNLNTSYDGFISNVFFTYPGVYSLTAESSLGRIASDSFVVSHNQIHQNSQPIGGDLNQNLVAQVEDDSDQPLLGIENPRFSIDNLQDSIVNDDELTFTLNALDSDGNLDVNYVGTIGFEVVDDSNATVPSDYTFTAEDAGSHIFSQSITFSSTGTKIIHIFDIDDPSIEAAFEFNVVSNESDVENQNEVFIDLESPISGLMTDNIINFVGKTFAGKEVKIFENDVLLVTLGSDQDGNFLFTTPPLPDGNYTYYVEVDGEKSDSVFVEIKTEITAISNFILSPNSVKPLKKFTLELTFNDRISDAAVIIDGNRTNLEATNLESNVFFGEITSPVSPGLYNISVLYTDLFGATDTFLLNQDLTVVNSDLNNVVNTEDVEFSNPNQPVVTPPNLDDVSTEPLNQLATEDVFIPPSDVTGLNAISDLGKVRLNWLPANDNTGIAFYIINFGNNPNLLQNKVQTFSDVTSFTLEDLPIDTTLFFSITAVDIDGNTSRNQSEVVSASTSRDVTSDFGVVIDDTTTNDTIFDVNPSDDFTANLNSDDLSITDDLISSEVETTEVGPSESIVFLSLLFTFFVSYFVRRYNFLKL